MTIEEKLADGFKRLGTKQCVIQFNDATITVALAENCPPITNACEKDSRCCLQNDHGEKCDISIHKHFDRILAHVVKTLGI